MAGARSWLGVALMLPGLMALPLLDGAVQAKGSSGGSGGSKPVPSKPSKPKAGQTSGVTSTTFAPTNTRVGTTTYGGVMP